MTKLHIARNRQDATPGDRYKWVALANTTASMFMATLDGSIVIIALRSPPWRRPCAAPAPLPPQPTPLPPTRLPPQLTGTQLIGSADRIS
jgi:hypothetical protein